MATMQLKISIFIIISFFIVLSGVSPVSSAAENELTYQQTGPLYFQPGDNNIFWDEENYKSGIQKPYNTSRSFNGGKTKIPLHIPRSWKPERENIFLPDTIYIGTDFNFFTITDDLKAWKSGGFGVPSDIGDSGLKWLDSESGYIHLEWEIGK